MSFADFIKHLLTVSSDGDAKRYESAHIFFRGFTAGCLKAALTVPALRPDSLTLLVDIGQPAQDWDKTMNKSLKCVPSVRSTLKYISGSVWR